MKIIKSTVSLTVDDVAASRDFFTAHLGFGQIMTTTDFASLTSSTGQSAAADLVLLRRGTEVLPEEQRHQRASGIIVAFTVEDIAAEEKRLIAEKANITMPLRTEPWGEKLLQLTDPNGVVVQLVEWITEDDA
ncbi:VOC family protein [Streptomyces sp. NPDC059247]|uniref:VOC family protein n=1 Tax=Streptomyces sp. NPDC059247 TaxID=3346790 RepID=UPI0036C71743